MTMVASFMPSMAFAAAAVDTHPTKTDYLDNDHEFNLDSLVGDITNADVEELSKDEVVEFTPATCTKDGSVTTKCVLEAENELCTATKTFVVKASHNNTVKRLTVEAYAKAMQAAKADEFLNDAQVARKIASISEEYCYVEAPICKTCGTIDKDHAAIASVGVAHEKSTTSQGADCKTTTPCVKCGKELKKAAGVAAKHSFQDSDTGNVSSEAEPTSEKELCGDVIAKTYTCTACGETKTTYTKDGTTATPTCKIFKKTISVVESKDKKTLYKSGTSVAVATRESETADWTAKPGYRVSEILANTVYEADTTVKKADGKTYLAFTCNECGYVTETGVEKTDVASTEHVHAWKKVTEAATCATPGYVAAYCEGCGMYADKANVTSKTLIGDTFYKITDVPDADDDENMPALGHKLNVKKVEATCEVPGHYEISCSVCGEDYDGEDYVQFVTDTKKDPLYLTADGNVSDRGAYGAIQLAYIDPAIKHHSFTKKIVLKEATCDIPELSGFKCDVCGKMNVHNLTETAGSELGHKAERVNEVAATCGSRAHYELQCSVCKKYAYNSDQTVWTKDHEDAEWFYEGEPVVERYADCTYDKWVVTKAATVFEEGVKTLTCSVCGQEHESTKTVVAKKTVAKAAPTVKAGKKSLTVKATAVNATGYKVSYKKSGAKSWKTVTVDGSSLNKTFKKLSSGKKYYVKVQAFAKNEAGDVVNGATSATKSVKVK